MTNPGNTSARESRLLERIGRSRDEIVELCKRLVRVNTVNRYAGDGTEGNEADGQLILQQRLEAAGAQTELLEVPENIFELTAVVAPRGRDFSGRPNLVAEWEFGEGPTLVINGHMDTVGTAGMEFDPFAAEVRDGAIWGRGTTDCKGQLSAAAVGLGALVEEFDTLSGRLIFQSVVEEECNGSGAGTLSCIRRGYSGDAVLVVDGGGLVPVLGCVGCLTAEIRVRGRSGHGSFGGVNAIEKAIVAKGGWDRFVEARRQRYPDCGTNLGIFKAGSTPSVVPHEALMAMNINYPVEEAEASQRDGTGWNGSLCLKELKDAVEAAAHEDQWLAEHPPEVEVYKDLYPFSTPAEEPLVALITQAARDVLGVAKPPEILLGWTDAAHFSVQKGVPVVCFGCGLPGEAHSGTEHVMIDDLVREAQVVALAAARFLGSD